ncbi:MAG: prephenate dehydratase, partial [Actinomycetota bacterium]
MTKARRVAYFGPAGTFTEQALLTQPDLSAMQRVPMRTVPDVLDAVTNGDVELGFVPIENSIEGTVNFTQDALVFDHELLIQREVVMNIQHCLLARPGTSLGDVKVVLSIPVATAQCHAFLRSHLGEADVRAANSTAEAAQTVANDASRGLAAIAPANAAKLYGLEILQQDIADHEGNQTRFVLVGRNRIPARTGHDKTGIVVFQRADEPGSLIGILQEFAARRINLQQL